VAPADVRRAGAALRLAHDGDDLLVRELALPRRSSRLPSGSPDRLAQRLAALAMPDTLRAELAPLVAVLGPLQREIAAADDRLAAFAASDPVMRRLASAPGVGPVTAAAFVAALDDVARFPSAHHVEAYLGLVPRERSAGERRRRSAITKAGNPRVRALLVEAAWCLTRSKRPDVAALRAWAERIARQPRNAARTRPAWHVATRGPIGCR
jgi:transposase